MDLGFKMGSFLAGNLCEGSRNVGEGIGVIKFGSWWRERFKNVNLDGWTKLVMVCMVMACV